jgi:hypothetical protein
MKHLWTAALLLMAAPAGAQTVETATGDWRNIPPMQHQMGAGLNPGVIAAIAGMVDEGECTIPGQRRGRLELTVPFLVQFKADGSIDRLILHALGCPRAEGLIASELLGLIQSGGFSPADGPRAGWFRSEVGFSHYAQ